MNKINFENAPSTNTPLSAGILNQIQANMEEAGAVISATEPITNEKVWFKKGKNLFNAFSGYDYKKDTYQATYKIGGSNKIIVTNTGDWGRVGCGIPGLKPNTQYTVSSDITNEMGMLCGIYFGAGLYDIQSLTSFKSKYTGATDENGNLYFQLYSNFTGDHTTADVIFDNIQVEQGTTATEYEPYIEKEIYTKNANGTYEQFTDIETITNKNGTAIKYPNGTMICIKKIRFDDIPINNAWGSFYYSEDIECGAFAQEFVGIPCVTKDLIYSSAMCMLVQSSYSPVDYNTAGSIVLCRPTSTQVNGTISITAIGKWK